MVYVFGESEAGSDSNKPCIALVDFPHPSSCDFCTSTLSSIMQWGQNISELGLITKIREVTKVAVACLCCFWPNFYSMIFKRPLIFDKDSNPTKKALNALLGASVQSRSPWSRSLFWRPPWSRSPCFSSTGARCKDINLPVWLESVSERSHVKTRLQPVIFLAF